MAVISKLNYLRIAPRKVRLVADLIRRKKVEEAQSILSFTVKLGSGHLLKLLNTAMADARNNFQLDPSNLFISKITVDEGPIFKRWKARSRGMAAPIKKRTSHVTIVLDEIAPGKKIKKIEKKSGEKVEEKPKIEKPKFKPEQEQSKPKQVKSLKKFFRRKSV
jgi:large subunit ribosomal protein L22